MSQQSLEQLLEWKTLKSRVVDPLSKAEDEASDDEEWEKLDDLRSRYTKLGVSSGGLIPFFEDFI